MTANEPLSLRFQELVIADLSHVFQEDIPIGLIKQRAIEVMPENRDRVFTPYNAYYHFYLFRFGQCHVIVPGKRDKNYKVICTEKGKDDIIRKN